MASNFNIRRDLLGGQFLSKKRWRDSGCLCFTSSFLILIYITVNLGIESTQLAQSKKSES